MDPYRDDVFRSDVLTIRWHRESPEAPRILLVEHDSGKGGVPEQRRLPEGYGIEALGGLFGLLALGGLLLHRLARSVAPVRTRVSLGPDGLTSQRASSHKQRWSLEGITGFGAGEDSPSFRTVFVDASEGRELLLEGLPIEDARRAVEALEEARRELARL